MKQADLTEIYSIYYDFDVLYKILNDVDEEMRYRVEEITWPFKDSVQDKLDAINTR